MFSTIANTTNPSKFIKDMSHHTNLRFNWDASQKMFSRKCPLDFCLTELLRLKRAWPLNIWAGSVAGLSSGEARGATADDTHGRGAGKSTQGSDPKPTVLKPKLFKTRRGWLREHVLVLGRNGKQTGLSSSGYISNEEEHRSLSKLKGWKNLSLSIQRTSDRTEILNSPVAGVLVLNLECTVLGCRHIWHNYFALDSHL